MSEEIATFEYKSARVKEQIQRISAYCDLVIKKAKSEETKAAVELIKIGLEKLQGAIS